jgi:hypothetical protein
MYLLTTLLLQVTAAEDAELDLFVASLSATALQLPLTLSPGGTVPLGSVTPLLAGGTVTPLLAGGTVTPLLAGGTVTPLLAGGTVTPGTVVPLLAGPSTVTDSHNPVSGLRICSDTGHGLLTSGDCLVVPVSSPFVPVSSPFVPVPPASPESPFVLLSSVPDASLLLSEAA